MGEKLFFSCMEGKLLNFPHRVEKLTFNAWKIIFSAQGGKAKEGGGVDTKEIMKRRRERAICIVSIIIFIMT